jgi:GntR family transcriptional repressor for pyruvate dehydrogenase complex
MFQKIKKETAVDKVAKQLRSLIENGEYKPGDKLPSERALCEMMAVSRIAVREAIRDLVAKNLLEVRAGNGTYVKTVTANDFVDPLMVKLMNGYTVRDLIEFREMIELSCCRLAVQRATDGDLDALWQILESMKQQLSEHKDYLAADLEFHNLIAKASGNKILVLVLNSVGDIIREVIRETSQGPGAPKRVYQLHYDIYNSLLHRNEQETVMAMKKHLKWVKIDLLNYHQSIK